MKAWCGAKPCIWRSAILPDGRRDILGIWIEQTEGAKFWLKVFTDLKARGCEDILIAVTDGLKGMPEALEAAYPQRRCRPVSCISFAAVWTSPAQRPAAARRGDPPDLCGPQCRGRRAGEFDAFAAGPWGQRLPMVVKAWRAAWTHVIPFFAFPPDVRRVIYTTNALESVHASIRKIIKTRGHFPNDDAAMKLIWLALRKFGPAGLPANRWKPALHAFALAYGDRFLRRET